MPDAMAQLKRETWDLHTRAEKHRFQHGILTGALPREAYVDYLAQLLLVHQALEGRLRALIAERPLRGVVHEYQYQVPYLAEDLDHFGVDAGAIEPLDGTSALLDAVRRAEGPATLLGMHYVLEGSNNGGRFIARAVARAYGLQPGPGLRYLDPYGEAQRERWAAFGADVRACALSEGEISAAVAGANDMFQGMIAMFDSLAERHDVAEVVAP